MMSDTIGGKSLAALVGRGGVYHGVSGAGPREILGTITGLLPAFPFLEKDVLLRAMLEREALMSTAIGRGIALPHPRTPLLKNEEDAFVAIAFPERLLDWNAPDGSGVDTIFLIVSSSAKQHLGTLSKIHFLCQEEKIYSLIKARAPKEAILAAIENAEAAWAEST
jgi:PTS system nitrogen regulatory IIA component